MGCVVSLVKRLYEEAFCAEAACDDLGHSSHLSTHSRQSAECIRCYA